MISKVFLFVLQVSFARKNTRSAVFWQQTGGGSCHQHMNSDVSIMKLLLPLTSVLICYMLTMKEP